MLDAFQVEYKTIVFAEDMSEANERLKVWRSLAVACGFEPGPGMVKLLPAGALSHLTAKELEKARAKALRLASPVMREQAIEGLATHLDGDVDLARDVVESAEQEHGPLSADVAEVFCAARKATPA